MPAWLQANRRAAVSRVDPIGPSPSAGESNGSRIDGMQHASGAEGESTLLDTGPLDVIPQHLLCRVPPGITDEESSFLVFGYLEFRAALHRDPTVPEFQAVLDHWAESPGPAAAQEVGLWISALERIESTVAGHETLPATEIATLRAQVELLPNALRGPWYLVLQTKAEYDNERDNDLESPNGVQREDAVLGGTCNVTSLAMAMRAMGIDVDAEALFDGLSPSRQQGPLYDAMGAAVSGADSDLRLWSIAASPEPEFWTTVVQGLLARGYGVVLHVPGHIVRLEAVTADGLVIDDPLGEEHVDPTTNRRKAATPDLNRGRDPGDTRSNTAGENNVWRFAEWLGSGAQPEHVQFIAPASLPPDVAGALGGGDKGLYEVTGGLLDGRQLRRR